MNGVLAIYPMRCGASRFRVTPLAIDTLPIPPSPSQRGTYKGISIHDSIRIVESWLPPFGFSAQGRKIYFPLARPQVIPDSLPMRLALLFRPHPEGSGLPLVCDHLGPYLEYIILLNLCR